MAYRAAYREAYREAYQAAILYRLRPKPQKITTAMDQAPATSGLPLEMRLLSSPSGIHLSSDVKQSKERIQFEIGYASLS